MRSGLFFYLSAFSFFSGWGNPADPSVTSGNASFRADSSDVLHVTASDRTIIAWNEFSIAPQETTYFDLPSATSVILNRVTSLQPSLIDGLICGNGTVYLINPNGITIGPTGRVETAAFLASTLDISDEDFLEGRLKFEGPSTASIVNEGEIHALQGDVTLISYHVKNSDLIDAPQGSVHLAAGMEVLLVPKGERHIQILAHIPDGPISEMGVDQQGVIQSIEAELQGDGNLYALAINQAGAVKGNGIEVREGRILLLAEGGLVRNSGDLRVLSENETGGKIEVLGETVVVVEEAKIDVSGNRGGGVVHIGGSYQGEDPNVLQATNTLVEKGVSVLADAFEEGNGGTVIIWAKNYAGSFGPISVRGGAEGGDGGFVEVSGLGHLDFQSFADRSAPRGKVGTLLLDPTAITISTGADTNVTFVAPNYTFTPAASTTATINIANLLTNLAAGNVNINSTNGAAAGTGVITIANAINWTVGNNTLAITSNGAAADIVINAGATITNGTASGTLTMTSARNITIAASISSASTVAGSISLSAPAGNISFSAASAHTISNSNAGSLSMTASTTITSNAAQTTFSFAGTGAVSFSGSAVTLNSVAASIPCNSSGALTVTSTAGNISIPPTLAFGAVTGPAVTMTATGGSISTTTSGTINGTGAFSLTAGATSNTILSGSLLFNSSGNFSVSTTTGNMTVPASITLGAGTGVGNITFQSAGTVTLSGTNAINNVAAGKTLTVTGPNGITSNAAALAFGSATGPIVSMTSSAGAISLTTSGTINGTGNFSLSAAATSATILSGSLTFNSSGSFSVSTSVNSITIPGSVTFGAAGGGAGPVSFSSATTLNLNGVLTFTLGAVGSGLTVTAPGAITINGSILYGYPNTLTITANAGNILFGAGSTLTVGSGAGSVLLQTVTSGNITFTNPNTVTFQTPAAGTTAFTVLSAGNIAMNTPFDYGAPGTCQFTSVGNFTANASSTSWVFRNGSGNMNILATATGSSVSTNAATAITFNAGAGNFTITSGTAAGGTIGMAGSITFNSGAGKTITMNGGGTITLDSLTYNSSGNCTITSANGTINFSAGSTIHFLPGSGNFLLTTTAGTGAAITTTNGTMTFDAGAGNFVMNANTNVTIGSPITYASSALATMTASTGNITTNAGGTIIFSGPGGLTMTSVAGAITNNGTITFSPGSTGPFTMNANGALTVGNTITYASTSPISLTSTANSITVNGAMSLSTLATLTFTANAVSPNGNFNINNAIRNTGGGAINSSCGNNLTVGTGAQATPSLIGSATGDVTFTNIGGNVTVNGGNTANAFAQIGFDSGNVASNIALSRIGSDVILNGGTANSCYALIGHGTGLSTGTGGTRSGNISFGSALFPLPGSVTIQGTIASTSNPNGIGSFAQIGHVRSPGTSPAIVSGNIDMRFVTNLLTITGGNRTGTYALLGHGGATSNQPDSYAGNIQVETALAGSHISLLGGTASDAFAGIGHAALFNGAGVVTVTSSLIEVIAGDGLSVRTGENAESFIGAYVKATGGGTGNIQVTDIFVQSGNNDIEVIGAAPSSVFNAVLIGALSYTGIMPLTAAGSAASNLSIDVGGALILQAGSESVSTNVFALLQNGIGSPAGGPFSTSITSTLNIEIYGGNNISEISSIGPLTINAGGGIIVFSDHNPASLGRGAILAQGTTEISADFINTMSSLTGPTSSITNTTGNMTLNIQKDITLDANSTISLLGGAGTLSASCGSDFLAVNNSSFSNLGAGSTHFTIGSNGLLYGGSGNGSITALGPLTLTIGDNLNLSSNPGGSGFITAQGALNITADNINLSGIASGQQSLITTTLGDMTIIANNTIELNDNALIANLGGGSLTIVVDQQAPLPPAVGPGKFILSPNAAIFTASGQNLRIFSATPNGITAGNLAFGQANGNYVTLGLTCPFDNPPPSLTAIYGVYYDTFAGGYGVPYTFFFKTTGPGPNPPSPPTPAQLRPFLPSLLLASSELFADLKEMMEECDCKKAAFRSYCFPMCCFCSGSDEPLIWIQE